MALWTLVPDKIDEDAPLAAPSKAGVFLTTAIAFFLVEMGDKTQVATVALGARFDSLLAVTAGTTNEKALRDLDARFKLGIQLQVVPDHAQGFALVASGRADAFATDDVLLYGLIAENAGKGGQYDVVGDYLSYDPYGIMFRKDDPQLAQVVKSTFEELAVDGEITRQYKRWFLRPLPSGVSLNLPMSQQLKTIIDAIGVKSD